MFKRLCKKIFKRTKWDYYNYVSNPHILDSNKPFYEYRFDPENKVLQVIDNHCLGLNPPTYIQQYTTIDAKPIFARVAGSNHFWYVKDFK